MRNRLLALAAVAFIGGLVQLDQTRAQTGGDQILDGIGETSLIARYVLDGNTQDRSRDGRHAKLQGSGTFVDDAQFGKVLSLSGNKDAHLALPVKALAETDAIAVVGWVNLTGNEPNQPFFDFGKSGDARFSCALTGKDGDNGFRAKITSDGAAKEQGPAAPQITTDHWVHVAVVLDPANKTLTTYADGARVGQTKDVTVGLETVIDQNNADANKLYIGRSRTGDVGLKAKLHDLRLYSEALTDKEVATIYKNATSGLQGATAKRETKSGESTASGAVKVSKTSGPQLTGVPDIKATTTVGQVPKLPLTIPGTYAGGAKGPEVRVIWPAPRNNNDVLKAGTYEVTGKVAGTEFTPKATVTVKEGTVAGKGPARKLESFPLGEVVLNKDIEGRDTMFIKNRDKFLTKLAETNPDNFLYMFRNAFGQTQPEGARALGGWDNQTTRLRGHASGHYLSALAQAYASTGYDPELQAKFLQKMNTMIDTLYDLSRKSGTAKEEGGPSNADPTKVPPGPDREGYDSNFTADGIRTDYWNWGKGFISAYPPDQFIMLEKGATYGARNNQIWAPYYTLHKILAGLLDCYEVGGNEKALEIAKGMGLWVIARLNEVPTETRIKMWNRYIAGEYGGMNEVMARLNRLTKDPRFLEGAKLFDNIDFFYGNVDRTHGLAANVDTLRDKHANQHIPQITGAVETYRDSQEQVYFRIAENFWDMATNSYLYSIGGVAGGKRNAECFTNEPDALWGNGFAQGGQNETCATYNMLKLTRQLFMFEPDQAKYMDYYEQALYNDILASVAENNAGNTYHIPLNPGARKQFGNQNMSGFTCCNGTALESNTKLQDSIYFKSGDNSALYVNLYVPSTLDWKEKHATVKQETNFPYGDTTKLTLNGAGGLDLHVRVPSWAKKGFFVKINNAEKKVDAKPGEYVSLGKDWKNGDVVELRMPFGFHLMRVMDQPNIASILYGPIVLAAEEDSQMPKPREIELNLEDMSKSISGDPAALRFTLGDLKLKPFYESYGRYSVYFDVKPE